MAPSRTIFGLAVTLSPWPKPTPSTPGVPGIVSQRVQTMDLLLSSGKIK